MYCVQCGKTATAGSAKHPYCEGHFVAQFPGGYDEFAAWLMTHNDAPDPKGVCVTVLMVLAVAAALACGVVLALKLVWGLV